MDVVAERIAIWLKKSTNHPTSVNVLKFGIEGVLNLIVTLIIILFVSLLLHQTSKVFTVAIAFGVLRMFTGGAHLKSSIGCTISSTILFVSLSYISISNTVSYILILLSLFILFRYSYYLEPYQSQRCLKNKARYKFYAVIWILIGILSTYFHCMEGFVVGTFSQILSITPLGIKLIHVLNVLNYIQRR